MIVFYASNTIAVHTFPILRNREVKEHNVVSWSVILLQVHFPGSLAQFLAASSSNYGGQRCNKFFPRASASRITASCHFYIYPAKGLYLSVTANDVRAELQGKFPRSGNSYLKWNEVFRITRVTLRREQKEGWNNCCIQNSAGKPTKSAVFAGVVCI